MRIFLIPVIIVLLSISNVYAKTPYQCPKPRQIHIIPSGSFGYWMGPKMSNSKDHGLGMGGLQKGNFVDAEEAIVQGKPGWVCYYGTISKNILLPELLSLVQVHNEKKLAELAKALPSDFGFLTYTAKE